MSDDLVADRFNKNWISVQKIVLSRLTLLQMLIVFSLFLVPNTVPTEPQPV